MNRLSFILRLVALAAASCSIAIYFAARNSLAEKAEASKLLERASVAKIKELDEAVLTIRKLEQKIQSERSALAEAKQALSEAQADLQSNLQKVSMTATQLARAESQILGQKTELALLRDKLLNAQRKTSSASQLEFINQLETSINALSEENKRLGEALAYEESLRVSLENSLKISVSKKSSLLDPNYRADSEETRVQGEIASINRKNRIVVLSNLAALELEPGQEIRVLSKGQLLGKARVFKVTDSYVVASLLTDFNAERIDAGSIVTILN